MTWDDWFFALAETVSKKSKDRSTKVGCVLVGPDNEIRSVGYNGFPRGVDDNNEKWHERPKKYFVTTHAEINAICNAALVGISTKGCTAYINLPPCSKCALALVQAGIKSIRFLCPVDYEGIDRWKEEFETATEIMTAVGVHWEWDMTKRKRGKRG